MAQLALAAAAKLGLSGLAGAATTWAIPAGFAAGGFFPGLGITAAGAPIAAAAGAAGGLSTVLSVLEGVATVAGIGGTLAAADAEASSLNQQALQTTLEAGQEQLASTQRQTVMKRELLRVLGENDVTIAAAGIDLSGGYAQAARQEANVQAARELTLEREDDDMRRALLRARAQGLRTKAEGVRQGGLLRAAEKGLSFAFNVLERG